MDVTADRAALQRLRRAGGADLVRKLIALFLENLPLRLQAAVAGVQSGNWVDVERAGHSLKSSAAYLGLRELSDAAAAVEAIAAQGGAPELLPLLNGMSESVPALKRHLLTIAAEG